MYLKYRPTLKHTIIIIIIIIIVVVVIIMQLVKLYDALAGPLAAGVVHMVEETGCLGFIKEMIREIAESEPEETDARNISIFLEAVATAKPNFFLPHLDDIMEHLSNDVRLSLIFFNSVFKNNQN